MYESKDKLHKVLIIENKYIQLYFPCIKIDLFQWLNEALARAQTGSLFFCLLWPLVYYSYHHVIHSSDPCSQYPNLLSHWWFSLSTSASHIYPIAQWHTFTLACHFFCCIFKYDALSPFSSLLLLFCVPWPRLHHHPVFADSTASPGSPGSSTVPVAGSSATPPSPVSGQHGGDFSCCCSGQMPLYQKISMKSLKRQRLSNGIQSTVVMNIFFTSFICLSWLNLHHSVMICLIYTFLFHSTDRILLSYEEKCLF